MVLYEAPLGFYGFCSTVLQELTLSAGGEANPVGFILRHNPGYDVSYIVALNSVCMNYFLIVSSLGLYVPQSIPLGFAGLYRSELFSIRSGLLSRLCTLEGSVTHQDVIWSAMLLDVYFLELYGVFYSPGTPLEIKQELLVVLRSDVRGFFIGRAWFVTSFFKSPKHRPVFNLCFFF